MMIAEQGRRTQIQRDYEYIKTQVQTNLTQRVVNKDFEKFLSCLSFLGSVRSRMYGAAAVCSVLLCVLLTVIIVLSVQLSTETHHCLIVIKNLRDECQNKYTDLMKKINQLQKEINERYQVLIENIKQLLSENEKKLSCYINGSKSNMTSSTSLTYKKPYIVYYYPIKFSQSVWYHKTTQRATMKI